jgi:hypothetical protein
MQALLSKDGLLQHVYHSEDSLTVVGGFADSPQLATATIKTITSLEQRGATLAHTQY